MMPYFIPEFVYVLPAAVYGIFLDFMMGSFDALSMANLGFFGILLAIIALILFIVGMLISLYIIVTVAAVAIRELIAQDGRMRAIFVNVDQIMASDPSLADKLFESFDLSSLPYIILTDRKGVISRRYLSYR